MCKLLNICLYILYTWHKIYIYISQSKYIVLTCKRHWLVPWPFTKGNYMIKTCPPLCLRHTMLAPKTRACTDPLCTSHRYTVLWESGFAAHLEGKKSFYPCLGRVREERGWDAQTKLSFDSFLAICTNQILNRWYAKLLITKNII